MERQNSTAKPMEINPTGMAKSNQYSDIALTGLFNAHVTTINSERQVIWMRYNTMVLANSFIFSSFLGKNPKNEIHTATLIIFSIIGIVLCVCGMEMFRNGWELFTRWNENAAQFSWRTIGQTRNPYALSENWRKELQKFMKFRKTKVEWMRSMAIGTLGLFIIGYLFLIIRQLF